MSDINHPRSLLPRWQEEAERFREHELTARERGLPGPADVFAARAACLEQCYQELRNRLIWSGMLDGLPT